MEKEKALRQRHTSCGQDTGLGKDVLRHGGHGRCRESRMAQGQQCVRQNESAGADGILKVFKVSRKAVVTGPDIQDSGMGKRSLFLREDREHEMTGGILLSTSYIKLVYYGFPA